MTIAEKYAAQNEKLLNAVETMVRWHYYDRLYGQYSANPAQHGIDGDILSQLEACLPESKVMKLVHEGTRWAELELDASFELEGDSLEWDDIKERV